MLNFFPLRRCAGFTLAILPTLILATLSFAASDVIAEPRRPASESEVLTRLSVRDAKVGGQLRAMRAALKRDPNNLALAIEVGRQYIGLGRAEADPRYYGYAQAALAPWWDGADPPADVLLLRAVTSQAAHDFDAALVDLDRVVALRPNHGQAWLSRAIVLRVQGRYAEAAESCGRMRSRGTFLARAVCFSAVRGLNGQADTAYRSLQRHLNAASGADPQLRLWALTILGEIAERTGKPGVAERHYRDAFALGHRNTYLLGALADLLLDQGRFADVRDLLRGEADSDPLLLRLAIAEDALGDARAADHVAALKAGFAADRRRGDSHHLREEARFALKLLARPEEALRLALDNWRQQREPWDARLVLEAGIAAGRADAVGPLLDWLKATRLEDVQIERLVRRLENDPARTVTP